MSKTANKDVRTPAQIKKEVTVALAKVEDSRTAEDIAKTSMLANIAADPAKTLPELNSLYDTADRFMKRLLLNFATTDFLAEEWGGSRIPALKAVNKAIQSMHGATAQLIEGASKVSNVIWNEFKADPSIKRPVEDLALTATLAEIDPSTDKRSPEINKLWDALPVAGKKVYTYVRDFYEDLAALHSKLLNDQIDNLSLSSAVKANLLSKVKAIYEVGDKIVPYFALVRRGQYFLRVGSGKNRQFYMFKTMMERDRVANELAKRRRMPLAELVENEEFQLGNDIASAREAYAKDSDMLTELFDAIDNVNLTGLEAGDAKKAKEDLKDAIYQLYLLALPEQKMRKQFIHREGITGFSVDMLQNFSDSAAALAVQLARIKYGPQIRRAMSAARSSIEGQRALEPFIEEMSDRVDLELPGQVGLQGKLQNKLLSGGEHVANFLNRGAFVHYLSGASSALLQPLSIIQFAMPILGAKYGYGAAAAKFAQLLKFWNMYGISTPNADGSINYSMPTIRGARGLTDIQRRAMEDMIGRNVGNITLSSTLLARQKVPAEQSLSTARNVLGMTWWAGSGGLLMHSAERLAQESNFWMSFDLNYDKSLAEFKKSVRYKAAPDKRAAVKEWENKKENYNKWIDQAVIDTHEGLGNMTTENRPPAMRNFAGRTLTQFAMFPFHTFILLGKNFFRMIKPLPERTRIEAAKTFFGILGMTVLMAGVVGLGFGLSAIGFISGMWDDFWEKEERRKTMKELSWFDWFKGEWLPNVIGGYIEKGTEKTQDAIDELSKLITFGGLNAATGADFSSRLGLLNLDFLTDLRTGRKGSEVAKGVLEGLAPPSFSQYKGYLDAIHAYRLGDTQTAAEKALPASARNLALTYELIAEGAKDYKGAPLLNKNSITTGQLLWRAVGFNSDKLADAQATNYRMNAIQKKILDERNSVMERFKMDDRLKNFDSSRKAKKAQDEFNRKYPWDQITDKNIDEALDKAREERSGAWRGFNVTDKNAPYAIKPLGMSRRELLRQEQEAAKNKKP